MRRILLAICFLCLCCASWQNDIAADGGIFGTYKGDYIVISESGGSTMPSQGLSTCDDVKEYREYPREFEKAPYTPPSNKLTGRYHLRGRSKGFFGRSGGRRVC